MLAEGLIQMTHCPLLPPNGNLCHHKWLGARNHRLEATEMAIPSLKKISTDQVVTLMLIVFDISA